ncbi:MAG: hypothetical protein JWP75_1975, partial [Frondihabitans sp.]|nr:hypothetical protein [Frondihabitans sp.]
MILKVSIAAAVAVNFLSTFIFLCTAEEIRPAGTTAIVTVWDSGTLSRTHSHDILRTEAKRQGLTLYRSISTVSGTSAVRDLYAINVPAGAVATIPNNARHGFSRAIHTRIANPHALEKTSVQGMYITDGREREVSAFASSLTSLGMSVEARSSRFPQVMEWASHTLPAVPCLAAVGLGLLVGCVQASQSHRRQDAIQLANGAHRSMVVVKHLRDAAVFTILCGAGGLAAAVPVLAIYNGLGQFSSFAALSLLGLSVVIASVALLTVLSSLTLSRERLIPPISRAAGPRGMAGFAFLAHAVALSLVIVSFPSISGGTDVV